MVAPDIDPLWSEFLRVERAVRRRRVGNALAVSLAVAIGTIALVLIVRYVFVDFLLPFPRLPRS